jgi:hypothetical protein
MATVRFSKELMDSIVKNARLKMQPAVDRAEQSRPDNSWGQRIYDTLFQDVAPLLAQVPTHWLTTTSDFTVEKVGGLDCDLPFKFATPQPWPRDFVASELALKSRSYYPNHISLRSHLTWGEFHAEVAAYQGRIKAAQERRSEFIAMVKQVIEAYATLAPALKAWPPLWDLIPEDVKNKHRQVVEREKKEVKLEVDLNKLTAMSTAAKFGV